MKKYKGSKWTEIYQKHEYISWCGYAFETICLKHSFALKKGLKCDQIRSENYAWSNANAQIDLVIDRDDNIVDLCEIKFSNDEISIDEYCDFFFANPYSPWERGSNENLNGLIRQYLPKKSDFNNYTEEQIKEIETKINNRPRKRFGYETPIFVMENLLFNPKVAFVA